MIVHLGPETQLAVLVRAERASGRAVSVVPSGSDKAQTLRLFADVLRFPDYFGHNLDALADSLRDWVRARPGPWSLIWDGTALLRATDPRAYAVIGDILAEAADADPAGRVTVVDR